MSEKIFAVIPVAPVSQSAVSRAVLALEKVGLVECLTPDEKMDRYYRITDIGKKVAEIIEGKGEIIFRGFVPLPPDLAGQITGAGIFPLIDAQRGALQGGGRSSQPGAWGHQPPSENQIKFPRAPLSNPGRRPTGLRQGRGGLRCEIY